MLVATVAPMPKDKRQLACTSDNFRAITALLPNCLMLLYCLSQYALATSHLQFGFKQHMSTIHCTYIMMETISHYNANGSKV